MKYDIVIVGAGPAGLSFASNFINSNLQILIVEKNNLDNISSAKPDGREIALTHLSKNILTKLGVWDLIDDNNISVIKSAIVLDASSDKPLNFNSKKLDELGYLVSNYQIRQALYNRIYKSDNITILTETTADNIDYSQHSAIVQLSTGETINTKLIIAADSRFSMLRRKIGISATMKDFAKTMMVVNVKLEKPHNGVALERFDYDKTVALLPMIGNNSSFILTVNNTTAELWKNMIESEFSKEVSVIFEQKFGAITQLGERHFYPLVGVHANKFIAKRFALLGDAAVGMHPVTAHGFNLGLKGSDILANAIKNATKVNADIGSNYILQKYQSQHIKLTKIMYFGTNIVIGLFTNEHKLLKPIRKLALKLARNLPPLKKAITHHLTSVRQ